jgi:hypothetical protein
MYSGPACNPIIDTDLLRDSVAAGQVPPINNNMADMGIRAMSGCLLVSIR